MIATSIILFVLLIITGLLFLPVTLVVNTEKKLYYISIPGYFKASIPSIENLQNGINMRIFFFRFRIKPGANTKKYDKDKAPKKKKGLKLKKPLLLIRKSLKNFKIRKFQADIDTGDFPLNAQLIPVANTLRGNKINLQINFENRNELDIKIITRIGTQIITFIKHRIKTN